MRRAISLCAAAGIALSTIVAASSAQAAPWYLIRYDNTGVCQVFDQQAQGPFKPWSWPSTYKTVSKPVPTFTAAMAVKEQLRVKGTCKW